jgi:hypothetical protein
MSGNGMSPCAESEADVSAGACLGTPSLKALEGDDANGFCSGADAFKVD